MQRLVIIDGHAILHRAFHALPPLTTSKGDKVNAVFGFVSMILRVIRDLNPSYLAVVFDRPKPTFRKKLFDGYQAKRPKMDDNLIPQVSTVHKVLEEMGMQIFELDGYEADDLIGTIIEKIKEEKIDAVIVTGDRDLLQLVNIKTKVYMPVKGLSESKLFGEKEVEEKFGIKPGQMIDYKALVGDQSDNYPGVPGIGPKTAAGLLEKFGTLEKLYGRIDEIANECIRNKLKDNEESAEMSKKLATIIRDVPIEIDLDKCKIPDYDRPNVHHIFEELEFRTLIPRLSKKTKNIESRIKNQGKAMETKKNIEQIKLF